MVIISTKIRTCTKKNMMQITLKMLASLTVSRINFRKIQPVQRCPLDMSLKRSRKRNCPCSK